MPLHARRLIVIAAKTVLNALPSLSAPGAVYEGRAAPKSSSATPFLLVYARPETSAPITGNGRSRRLLRELTLAVEIVTAEGGAETGDALLDQLALEIETTLAGEPTLGGACRDLFLARTDPVVDANGEVRIGRSRLEFQVHYQTAAIDPSQAI